VSKVIDRTGKVTTLRYDERNRLTRIEHPDGPIQTRVYDSAGRLSEIREGGDVTAYTYDEVNRATKVTTGTVAGHNELAYSYDSLDRMVRRTLNGGDPTTYAYDLAGRLASITYRGQTTTYSWDNAGRLTGKTLPDGIRQTIQYDEADRITQIQYLKPDATLIDTIAYTYDADGNRTTKTSSVESVRETPFTATYNEANRLTSITFTDTSETYTLAYDGSGNLTSKTGASGTTIYSWDGRNRLTEISGPGSTATFQYDARGRRVGKTVNGTAMQYVYDGPQVIGELTNGVPSAAILTGLRVDEVVARYSQAGNRSYLTDALGSVIAQARDGQSIQNYYAYTPYGESVALGDDEGNAIQYTARENDQTGLYFYQARYYDPVLKRFISEDPIGLLGGGNLYAYVYGNPTGLVDPEGFGSSQTGNPFRVPPPREPYYPRETRRDREEQKRQESAKRSKDDMAKSGEHAEELINEQHHQSNTQCIRIPKYEEVCDFYNPPMCTPSNPSGDTVTTRRGPFFSAPGGSKSGPGYSCYTREVGSQWSPGCFGGGGGH
jgi:RHS repeat-associated protein